MVSHRIHKSNDGLHEAANLECSRSKLPWPALMTWNITFLVLPQHSGIVGLDV
jgi:hypothetical protein